MTPFCYVGLLWLVVGFLSSLFGIWVDVKRGIDFKLSDLIMTVVYTIFGFASFCAAISHYTKYRSELGLPSLDLTIVKGRKGVKK